MKHRRHLLLIVILLGLLPRLFITATASATNPDIVNFTYTVEVIEAQQNLYREQRFYNYSPFFGNVLALMHEASGDIPFNHTYRVLLLLADCGVAVLIYLLARRRAFLIYWLNPVTWAYLWYAQFDLVALLPLLAAVYAHKRGMHTFWVVGLVGLSFLTKHIMLPMVWMVLISTYGFRRGLFYMLVIGLVFLASFIPYVQTGWEGILQNVIRYPGYSNGGYGFSSLVPGQALRFLMLFIVLILPFALKQSLLIKLWLSAMVFVVFSDAVTVQYLITGVVLGTMLRKPRWLFCYSLAVLASQISMQWDHTNLVAQMYCVWGIGLIGVVSELYKGLTFRINSEQMTYRHTPLLPNKSEPHNV